MKEVSSVRITLERYKVGADMRLAYPLLLTSTLFGAPHGRMLTVLRNSGRIVKRMPPGFSGGGRSRSGLLNLEISSEEPVDSLLRLGCGCEDGPSIVSQDR